MGPGSDATGREAAVGWLFVAVQAVLLVAIAVIPGGDAWSVSGVAAVAARGLQWLGAVVLVVGLVSLGRSLTAHPSPLDRATLHTGGLYRWVRHPIYAGILALACGASVLGGSVAMAAATFGLVGLFAAKARWEEARLRARYPAYADYQRRTPRFVPLWPFGADRGR